MMESPARLTVEERKPTWVSEEGATYHAYSAAGPDGEGVRSFDPQKVLLDPYARCVLFPEAFDRTLAMREGSNAGKGLHVFRGKRNVPEKAFAQVSEIPIRVSVRCDAFVHLIQVHCAHARSSLASARNTIQGVRLRWRSAHIGRERRRCTSLVGNRGGSPARGRIGMLQDFKPHGLRPAAG